MDNIKKYFSLTGDEQVTFYLKHFSDMTTKNFKAYFDEQDKLANIKYYHYLVTFTLKPTIPKSQWDSIEDYIKNQFKREPLKIHEAHITREYTKKLVAHWHVSVTTTKPLKKDRFNYYIQQYGNIDISKSKAQNLEEGLNYINKCSTSTLI